MAEIVLSAEFPAPPKEIFVFFVPQRMPLWYGAEMRARFEVQSGVSDFAAGQKVRITGKVGGREVALTVIITAYEWCRLLEWRFQDSYGVKGLQRWELAPNVSSKCTHLTMRDSYEMPGALGRLMDRLFTRRAVERRDRAWLTRLQSLVTRV